VKILVNATTITVGGGVQAAGSFIEYAGKLDGANPVFLFAVSESVWETLSPILRSDSRILVFSASPAHPLRGRPVRRALLRLEEQFQPDLVYSIGFPSYVRFKAPEVGRYTNGWEICFLPAAWATLSFSERISRALRSLYRLRWAKQADYFETQTDVAKAGVIRKLHVPPERVLVLPNSVNPRFVEAGCSIETCRPLHDPPRILCLSAAHRHKNLTIIPSVAKALTEGLGTPCVFVLTLPFDSDVWRSILREADRVGVGRFVENVGPLTLDGCVAQYREADCLFLPTLAEIFSATYLEAMAMCVPIVTTDLDFAHAVCADAALYFDPLSPESAAQALRSVLRNHSLREDLVRRGRQRLGTFPDPDKKHAMLLDWLAGLARQERTRRVGT
jgi:glycosyltransferase involved in cell wall biosynthesis